MTATQLPTELPQEAPVLSSPDRRPKKRNKRTKNLWKRGDVWYFVRMVKGKRSPVSLETSDLSVACAKRDAMLKASGADEIARVLGKSPAAVPTVGEICAAYELEGSGRDYVRRNNITYLRLLLRTATGITSNDELNKRPATIINQAAVLEYQAAVARSIRAAAERAAMAGGRPNEEAAARTKYSADRVYTQARAVFAKETPFRNMSLPACIQAFRRTDKFGAKIDPAFTPMLQAEVDLFAAESKLVRSAQPGVYLTYLLMQWLGLRNDEVLHVKPAEWITRRPDGTGVLRVARYPYFEPKGVGSFRSLAVPAWLLAEIDALTPAPGQPDGREWLIPGEAAATRKQITHRHVNAWMRGVYERARAQGVLPATVSTRTSYDFRKQAGSIYYAQTKDLLATQRFLGHESPDTTTKWYANMLKELAPIAALQGR